MARSARGLGKRSRYTLRILYYFSAICASFGGGSRIVIDLVLGLIIGFRGTSICEARVLSLSVSGNSTSPLKGFTAIGANSSYSAGIDMRI